MVGIIDSTRAVLELGIMNYIRGKNAKLIFLEEETRNTGTLCPLKFDVIVSLAFSNAFNVSVYTLAFI